MYRPVVLIISFLFCWAISQAQTELPNNSASHIDVLHYKINLRFDWIKKQAKGEVTISLAFTQATQNIQLAATDLFIRSVQTADKKQISFKTDTLNNNVQLSLPRIYNKGDKLTFTISYETLHHNDPDPAAPGGSFGKGIRFFQPTQSNPIKRKQLWSQSELLSTSYWLPCTENISDVSTTEIIAIVDKGLTFIANGKLLREKENLDSTVTFYYQTSIPYPIYLTAFVAGEYKKLVQRVNGTTLCTYCYPDEQKAAIATTGQLPGMLQFLEKKTGLAYPYKQYSQVMVQDYPFPGRTGQNTLGIISDNMIDDYGTHKDYLYLWDGVEFNALAGQWFGNAIIPKNIQDIWLSKSLAQYFEGLYTTEKNGIDEYLLWYHPWETSNVMGDWNNGNRHAIAPEKVNDAESFAGDSYAKYRGALVLRMLQKELGEVDFIRSIRHFIKKKAFKTAVTSDLQNTIKEVTGKDLQWFFDQWIYKTGHPIFEFTDRYDPLKKQLSLKIKQVQQKDSLASYPQTNYFKGKIEIEIDNVIKVVELLPKVENEFSIAVSAEPKLVNLDPDNIWIREFQIKKNKEEWLYQFLHSKHALTRTTAMTELTAIAKTEEITQVDKKEIIDAFQTVISGNAYWRFRFNAIGQLRNIQPRPYDTSTIRLLTSLIKKEKSWIKAGAITSLGMTNDSSFTYLYISCFTDTSDRVINAAAIALGKTKSHKAFDALVKLKDKPSWKSQSLMHCLSGLAVLGDPRGENIALAALADDRSPRWFLGNGWDYPFVAVQTLAKLGKTENAYAILLNRFNIAMLENNIDDIFHQVILITNLGNPKGLEIFNQLKLKFSGDENTMIAIQGYEEQLKALTPIKK